MEVDRSVSSRAPNIHASRSPDLGWRLGAISLLVSLFLTMGAISEPAFAGNDGQMSTEAGSNSDESSPTDEAAVNASAEEEPVAEESSTPPEEDADEPPSSPPKQAPQEQEPFSEQQDEGPLSLPAEENTQKPESALSAQEVLEPVDGRPEQQVDSAAGETVNAPASQLPETVSEEAEPPVGAEAKSEETPVVEQPSVETAPAAARQSFPFEVSEVSSPAIATAKPTLDEAVPAPDDSSLVTSSMAAEEPAQMRVLTAAAAASRATEQCNGIDGAGLAVTCDVTVTNSLDLATGDDSSTVTVRSCLDAAGVTPTNCTTSTTVYDELTTSVTQCNNSGNGGGGTMTCTVTIINNITGEATSTPVTVNQCNGSGDSPGGTLCNPYPANTTGAVITQCNGSANGGGTAGRVKCTVEDGSTQSSALPITVVQCNDSENGGGSLLTCSVSIMNNMVPAGDAHPGDTPPGETPPDDTPPGDTPPDETPQHDTPPGEAPVDETPQGGGHGSVDDTGGSFNETPPEQEHSLLVPVVLRPETLPGVVPGAEFDHAQQPATLSSARLTHGRLFAAPSAVGSVAQWETGNAVGTAGRTESISVAQSVGAVELPRTGSAVPLSATLFLGLGMVVFGLFLSSMGRRARFAPATGYIQKRGAGHDSATGTDAPLARRVLAVLRLRTPAGVRPTHCFAGIPANRMNRRM